MEEKQTTKMRLFTALFVLALVLPFPLFWLFHPVLDTENRENRALATFPQLAETGISGWPQGFEDFLGDHAAFRNQFMTLRARLNYGLFHCVDSSEVLLGSDGWLFYRNVSDSASLDDYQGINGFTEAEQAQIAANLTALQENLAARGTKLVVMIIPNKERVYSEHMPATIPVVGPNRCDTLAAYLQDNTAVPMVYPVPELLSAKTKRQIYYRQDTHWNAYGAYVGSTALQATLGCPAPACTIEDYDSPAVCDLANLSALWTTLTPETSCGTPLVPGVTQIEDGSFITRYTGPGTGRLLMMRDSFGAAMAPQLAGEYASADFVHLSGFGETTFDTYPADVFVWELVERNADRFLDYLPRLVEWSK